MFITHSTSNLTTAGVPTDIGSGESGLHSALLEVFRAGTQVRFDLDGNETTSAEDSADLVLNAGNDFSRSLILKHDVYRFELTALDTRGKTIADGSLEADIQNPGSLAVPLLSLASHAELSVPQTLIPGEMIDVMLTVSPYEDSTLVSPNADFEVTWEISGTVVAEDETSKLGVRISPVQCQTVSIIAFVTRAGAAEATATASVTLPDTMFCAGSGIGVGDYIPPALTVDFGLPATAITGATVTISGTATDAHSGMNRVTIFDGARQVAAIAFSDGQSEWETTVGLDQARDYNFRVVATDNAGNEARALHTISVANEDFLSIHATGSTVCGITELSRVLCWGGAPLLQYHPSLVPEPPGGERYTSLDTSWSHICGVTDRNNVYCWLGSAYPAEEHNFGILGNGSTAPVGAHEPALVRTDNLLPGEYFESVHTGPYQTCGHTNLYNVYCWGRNRDGGLGINEEGGWRHTPLRVFQGELQADEYFTSITVSQDHESRVCGLTNLDKLYCWGSWRFGIGGPGKLMHLVPTEVPRGQLENGEYFTQVDSGSMTICGLTNFNQAYCWGRNNNQELGLGHGNNTAHLEPVRVHLGDRAEGEHFTSIGLGRGMTCGITNHGETYCWGNARKIGLNTLNDRHYRGAPTRILTSNLESGERFTSLVLGDFISCGLTNYQQVYCWGSSARAFLPTRLVPTGYL